MRSRGLNSGSTTCEGYWEAGGLSKSHTMNNRGRGLCVMVINSNGDKIIDQSYDTHSNDYYFRVMLGNLNNGDHLLIAAYDSASSALSGDARNFLAGMGADQIHSICYRCGYIFGGIKGRTDGRDDLTDSYNTVENNYYYGVDSMRVYPTSLS